MPWLFRFLLLLVLAGVLALPARAPAWAAGGGDAPCPSKPAALALAACLDPALAAASRAAPPVQGSSCDLAAIEPAVPPLTPFRAASRVAFFPCSTERAGHAPSAVDPPPRAA